MEMHHCPRCELRFVNTSELRQHFTVDHDGDAGTFERYRYRAGPASGAPAVRTLLLVGNQTLEDQRVLDDVVARAGDQSRVLVLAPVTHDDDTAETIAGLRLRSALDRLQAAGVDAAGSVGGSDPFAAVVHLLADEHVDEIVVSTLPAPTSRWLGVDLPDRLRRQTRRPVAVLTPKAAEPR